MNSSIDSLIVEIEKNLQRLNYEKLKLVYLFIIHLIK